MRLIIILIFMELIFLTVNNNEFISNENYVVPKRLWLFWEGILGDLPKFCIHKLKQNLTNYKIILVNYYTIRNYFNSTDIPPVLLTLPLPNQADYFRFQLLSQYGGIYIWILPH